jgi:cyclic pyranopterin phosphate synthase
MGQLRMSLTDRFGRTHTDLRLSLTDRCNLRCTYCMPAEGVEWIPGPHLLTPDEIERLVRIGTGLGIRTVRLTGGEPLLHTGLVEIVTRLARLPQPPEMSMTTNGIGLAEVATGLRAAGLSRINVSLDTLRPDRFRAITRRDGVERVIDGVVAAVAAGLSPVKVNAVLIRGVNDDEAPELLRWALSVGAELRFIEQMPLDAGRKWSRDSMVTTAEVMATLGDFNMAPLPRPAADPAATYAVDGGVVGFVASVTEPFCAGCDRMRLTADGQLRNCLFSLTETDLRTPMRDGASDAELSGLFVQCIGAKLPGHGIDDPEFIQPARPMSAIGG